MPAPGPAEPADAAGRDARQDKPAAGGQPGDGDGDGTGDGDDDASWDGCPDMTQWQHERRGTTEDDDHHDDPGDPARAAGPVPGADQPHRPGRHRLGWSAAPGEAGGWGLTDPGDTRRLLSSRLPCTPAPAGASPSSRPTAPRSRTAAPAAPTPGSRHRETASETATDPTPGRPPRSPTLLRDLNVTFTPIAKGSCDHASAEDRYTPSRKLKHLVRARTATCPAPGCGAQAVHGDLDHTLAYPAGITCQCDLAPPCRRHHRVKQAPGWTLDPARTRHHALDHTLRTQLHHRTPTVYEM